MGGGPYYAALGGSRILNASRVDQSGADDANVTDWDSSNDIIIAVNINSGGKDTEAAQYKLRWRDETDSPGGAFGDLDTAGECKFGATDLSNGTEINEAGRKCDSQGNDSWQTGYEVEGTKLSTSIDLADEYETEIHFSVSLSDGDGGHQYTFDLYDDTRGAQVGVLGAQITLAVTDVEVSAGVASLNLATYQADVNAENEVDAGVVNLNLVTYQATVDLSQDVNVSAGVVGLNLVTYQADVNAENEVDASVVNLNLATYQANVNAEREIDASLAALTLQTYSATITCASGATGKSVMKRIKTLNIIKYMESDSWH